MITADEAEPVFARVHAVTRSGDGPTVVHLDLLPGDALGYTDSLGDRKSEAATLGIVIDDPAIE